MPLCPFAPTMYAPIAMPVRDNVCSQYLTDFGFTVGAGKVACALARAVLQ